MYAIFNIIIYNNIYNAIFPKIMEIIIYMMRYIYMYSDLIQVQFFCVGMKNYQE